MVWVFASDGIVDSRRNGPSIYSFMKAGTYTIGRKDCTVVINTDKAVSRLHAEIILDRAVKFSPSQHGTETPRAPIKVKDKSKLGTFVNKAEGAESNSVLPRPDGETALKDGDVVRFGTSKTTFRISFIPLVFCIPKDMDVVERQDIEQLAADFGVHLIEEWCSACTHLLIRNKSCLSPLLATAIASGKPVLTLEYLLAFRSITSPDTPLPSTDQFAPQVFLHKPSSEISQGDKGEGLVTVASLIDRHAIFHGITFFVTSSITYSKSLPPLLEAAGGMIMDIDSARQEEVEADVGPHNFIFVLTDKQTLPKDLEGSMSAKSAALFRKLPRTTELKLMEAVLTGCFDMETALLAPAPNEGCPDEKVAMSTSTDETIDESEGVEVETATSARKGEAPDVVGGPPEVEIQGSRSFSLPHPPKQEVGSRGGAANSNSQSEKWVQSQRTVEMKATGKEAAKTVSTNGQGKMNSHLDGGKENGAHVSDRRSAEDESLTSSADIIYAKLVVRNRFSREAQMLSIERGATLQNIPNFKRFRKAHQLVASGNSYTSLVPFAEEPYRESDLKKDVEEFMKREKKRKESEAAADELFHADRLKRQKAVSGNPQSSAKGALPIAPRPPRGR